MNTNEMVSQPELEIVAKLEIEKANKTDQSKVVQQIEYIPSAEAQNNSSQKSFSIAMPPMADPMFGRWASAQDQP